MTHREQLAILALLIGLVLLAILFPRPAASDVPVVVSRIPASEFEAIRSAEPLASGQASISADPSLRTTGATTGPTFTAAPQGVLPGGVQRPTPSPSASKRVPTPTPVRITETPARESSAGSAASAMGRSVPAATSTPLRGKLGVVVGTASWFRSPRGVSAAGPALRRALGPGWRGSRVTVCAGRCITVVLGDWCACSGRVIDLDDDQFARLAPLSRGVVEVSIRW